MSGHRLKAVDWLAAACGAALIGSLWLPWYHGPAGIGHLDAWQSMAFIDAILFICGVFAIVALVVSLTQPSGAVPVAMAAFAAAGGIVAAVLTVIRLIWPPGGVGDREAGVWIGTVLAIALAVTASRAARGKQLGAAGLVPGDAS